MSAPRPLSRLVAAQSKPRAGGPPSMTLVYIILTEGAPSLRSLQGWVAMLPTQFVFFRTNAVAHAFVVPPFADCAKDGAPSVLCQPAIKSPGHSPFFSRVTRLAAKKRLGQPPFRQEKRRAGSRRILRHGIVSASFPRRRAWWRPASSMTPIGARRNRQPKLTRLRGWTCPSRSASPAVPA